MVLVISVILVVINVVLVISYLGVRCTDDQCYLSGVRYGT